MKEEVFFRECLELDYPGLEKVKQAADGKDYAAAKRELADYIRRTLQPERFFQIPYETPENVFKYPEESDEQACERILRKNVFLSVGVPCDFGVGQPVNWLANPTENQYREWTWQFSRHNEWKMLAKEYRQTGNEAYAKAVADLFLSWVAQAPCPKEASGYDTECWRTIECGIRMGANWPYVLFAFLGSAYFTDELLYQWYASVWEHGNRLFHFSTSGNWLLMEMNGLAHIGILYPQLRQSKLWLQTAMQRILAEAKKQFYPDGFHYELTTLYHEVSINNYQRLWETTRVFEQPFPKELIDILEKACEVNIKLMMPNGRLPDINDGKNWSVHSLLLPKQRMLPQTPNIGWAVGNREKEPAPEYASAALEYSGIFVMRSGWSEKDVWALFDAAPFGKGHQHEDKLSLMIFAEGRLLLTEGGNYAYDDSEMRKYVLSGRAHNIIRVSGRDQNRRQSYAWKEEDIFRRADMDWHIGKTCDYAESVYREAYGELPAGQTVHRRAVYFIKHGILSSPFFLVVDRLTSEREQEYEMLWHIDDELLSVEKNGVYTQEMSILLCGERLELEMIRGRREPEWQGFAAFGTEPGMYRLINCISAKSRGKELRFVTGFFPKQEKGSLSLRAGSETACSGVELLCGNGRVWRLDEEALKRDALPEEEFFEAKGK